MLPVELCEASYQNEQSMDNCIILLFNSKYKCRWINVVCLQDTHNINAAS